MDLKKSYIIDSEGRPKAVVIDYKDFKKIEQALLDYGLGKAMEEIEDDEEVELEEAKIISGYLKQKPK